MCVNINGEPITSLLLYIYIPSKVHREDKCHMHLQSIRCHNDKITAISVCSMMLLNIGRGIISIIKGYVGHINLYLY